LARLQTSALRPPKTRRQRQGRARHDPPSGTRLTSFCTPAGLAVGFGPKELSPSSASISRRFTPKTFWVLSGSPVPWRHPGARRLGISFSLSHIRLATHVVNGCFRRLPWGLHYKAGDTYQRHRLSLAVAPIARRTLGWGQVMGLIKDDGGWTPPTTLS
jgi:hypothetical protein